MTYRHAVALSAVLLLLAGCGSAGGLTQTSMLRGPTPSSGMTIPRLLTASAAPTSPDVFGTGQGSAPAESEPPGSTDSSGALPPDGVTSSVPDDGASAADPGSTPVDLATVAAAFNCTDYAAQSAQPLTSSSGQCTLDGQPVQLYAFASDEDYDAFLDQLGTQGLSADQLVQGPLYLVSANPDQLDAIASALSAG